MNSDAICFSMWYYVDSESKFNLTIGYYSDISLNNLIEKYRTTNNIVSRTWKQIQTTILLTNINISISLKHSNPFIGAIAIDDIRVTKGECIENECDFTSGFCGMDEQWSTVPASSDSMGERVTGITKQVAYGPQTDHKSGEDTSYYYLFGKRSYNKNYSHTTNLIMNNLTSTGFGSRCLKFWYQIDAPTTSSFYIYVAQQSTTNYFDPDWEAAL